MKRCVVCLITPDQDSDSPGKCPGCKHVICGRKCMAIHRRQYLRTYVTGLPMTGNYTGLNCGNNRVS